VSFLSSHFIEDTEKAHFIEDTEKANFIEDTEKAHFIENTVYTVEFLVIFNSTSAIVSFLSFSTVPQLL
jgi:hypothetical protein